MNPARESSTADATELDIAIIGAGFAGMYALYKFRQAGYRVRAFEASDEVGGVWNWNRYPGARCDIESMQYSYSFSEELQRDWKWSEKYAAQPEILEYARHVATRFDLRKDIQFNTFMDSIKYEESTSRWVLTCATGEKVLCKFVIAATGCLSAPKKPEIEGFDDFEGQIHYTSMWPRQGVNFTNARVAVIGTGSSGCQSVPEIARVAKSVTVFQRTANFCVPAHNQPMDPEDEAYWKSNYVDLRERQRTSRRGWIMRAGEFGGLGDERSKEEKWERFEQRWTSGGFAFIASYDDMLKDLGVNEAAAEFVKQKIASIVKDSEAAQALTPTDHPIGTKRMVVENGYYEAFNRANVKLVNLRTEPIERIGASSVKTSKQELPVDILVLATGFDAMTGSLQRLNVVGRGGVHLNDKWSAGPVSYLGLMVSGFPNFFTITGPGSPSVLSNMFPAIEQHVDLVGRILDHLRSTGRTSIEADNNAETKWVAHVNEVANSLLYRYSKSWYLGSNVAGKPEVFMPYAGGVVTYRDICNDVITADYRGFHLA